MFAVAGATAALALLLILNNTQTLGTGHPTADEGALSRGWVRTATSAGGGGSAPCCDRREQGSLSEASAAYTERKKAPEPASTLNAVQRVVTGTGAGSIGRVSRPAEPAVEIAIPVRCHVSSGRGPSWDGALQQNYIVSADGSAKQLGLASVPRQDLKGGRIQP